MSTTLPHEGTIEVSDYTGLILEGGIKAYAG
jgi:hypothetical protein